MNNKFDISVNEDIPANELEQLVDEIIELMSSLNFVESDDNTAYLSLLNKVAELGAKDPEKSAQMVNHQGDFQVTPLHTAAGAGLFKLVQELVKFNPDYTLINCFGQTAAMRALKYAKRKDIADFINDHAVQQENNYINASSNAGAISNTNSNNENVDFPNSSSNLHINIHVSSQATIEDMQKIELQLKQMFFGSNVETAALTDHKIDNEDDDINAMDHK
ncbi:MAG: ankyrin repeat domain-containing protein [Legionella sp.]|jgi:hypothetical protein